VLLARETSIGVRSFVGQYLPILDFPRDVREPLERGEINLFEAHQLARLTSKRLGCTDGEARARRRKLLDAHLLKQEPSARLRERVKEVLGELSEPDPVATEIAAVEKADELLEADPLDSTHLFFEELRRIGRALREIRPEELTGEDVDELMPAVDQVSTALMQIERRKQRRQEGVKKIKI
jgi:phosphoenolpyruvate carboxylase